VNIFHLDQGRLRIAFTECEYLSQIRKNANIFHQSSNGKATEESLIRWRKAGVPSKSNAEQIRAIRSILEPRSLEIATPAGTR
jgi:ABC-type transport system involved in cytochrome bd biosynthesis fused ATPase/permease subunit